MASFDLRWRRSAEKELRKLPRQEIARIVEAVGALAEMPLPFGSQKLAGSEQTYRIRVGDYRVLYEVLSGERLIEIQRVRHRKDVYR